MFKRKKRANGSKSHQSFWVALFSFLPSLCYSSGYTMDYTSTKPAIVIYFFFFSLQLKQSHPDIL